MKKRRIILFGLVIALVVSLSVGCGSKTPKEILEDAIINSTKIKTSQQSAEINLSLDMETDDPMVGSMLQMFKDITIEMDMKSDSENMKSVGEITADLGGIAYTLELFVTPEQVAFKFPMITPQYIVQEIELDEEVNDDAKLEMSTLIEEITKAMLENMEDEKIVNNGSKTIKINNEDVKVTEIAVEMSDEQIKEVLEKTVEIVFENPQMKEYFAQSYKTAFEADGIEITDEELEEAIDEMKNEMILAFDEMKDVLQIDDFSMTFFIDSKSNIRKNDFGFTITLDDEEIAENITLEMNGSSEIWNINQELEMDIPEFDEENSITIEELTNQMYNMLP